MAYNTGMIRSTAVLGDRIKWKSIVHNKPRPRLCRPRHRSGRSRFGKYIPLVAFAVCATPVLAHHGPGTFELNKSVTYTGKLTRIEFVNPHSWLYFEVTDASGKVSKHRCEMRSAHTLRRSGWTKELFPINSKVTIEAAPDRADPNSCYLNTVRFENGSHMDRYGQYV